MRRLMAVLFIVVMVSMNFLGLLFLVSQDVSAEEYVSGSINTDTTWTLVNSPYIVLDNVTVEVGVNLTIEPGVEVRFNGSFSLIINGTLNATGTSSLPINFTSNQTSPSEGDWLGIKLQSANNTLDYCQISYGDQPMYINGSNANNKILNCKINNNTGDGIHLNNTTHNTLFNITVSLNHGNGITLSSSENNTIENCTITQNNGSGINFNTSLNNRIENNNVSYNRQDAIYLEESSENTIENNILFHNTRTGINLTSSSTNNIIEINNITSNNQTGILITNSSNSNMISRNNIYNNSAVGININGSINNQIHHNNFESNGQNAYDSTNQLNSWDNGAEGNWWSDYTGSDGNGDGIGDTPYDVPGGGSKDRYPLMAPVNISAPIVENTIPHDGAENVSVDPQISITFSNEMNKTATENATSMSGGVTPTNFEWSNGNQTMTFEPSLTLDSETTYTVNVSTDAKDLLEYQLQLNYNFSFNTKDVISPEITLTSPANGTIDVALSEDVVVTFSEAINVTTVIYTCTPDPSGWSEVWSNGNQTVTYSHDDFAGETNYTFNITGAKDVAGNDLVAGAVPNPFEFTTEDATSPEITITSPVNASINVLITTDIIVTFNEEMNTSTVNYTCTPDPGGWSEVWSNNNQTVTYSHDDFTSETTYTFNITEGKDLAGNDLAPGAVPNPWEFTTEDVTTPEITVTSPVNGTTNILIDADIIVTFNEEMNTSTVAYNCTPDPGGWSEVWSNGNQTVTYSHDDFTSETNYTFNITSGKDLAGNNLTVGAVPNPFEFMTEDAIGPEITTTSPVNGSTNVLITADIIVTFNEEMNTSTVTYNCTPDPGGWSEVWSNGNQTVTYSHDDFTSETNYTFNITGAKDVAGNDLVAGAVPNPWSFTTEDVVGPEITTTSPVNGSTNVLITADIIVTFNEEMNTSAVTYTCTPDPGGWSEVWSNGNQTVTYSHDDFTGETTYMFNITGGKDLSGNALVSGAVPNPWSFTTEDVTSPEITVTSPVNGTTNVPIDANIIVNFTEEMNTTTVTFTCTPNPGGWAPSWSNGNQTVTYTHNAFDSETTYIFEITAAKDMAGNDVIPGAVPNPFEFTTEDVIGPEITTTSPADGTTDVVLSANVVVTFSEAMNTSSVTYNCTPDPGGWSVIWSGGNTTATYSHDPFTEKTEYTFEITGGKDDAGNDMVPGAVPNPWTFTTVDLTPPEITVTSPINGTINVPITANIIVTFNEEMNTSTVTYTCSPDPSGWSVVWSGGNTTATYSHNAFDSETNYTFEITAAKDVAGNDLVSGAVPNPFEFTTKDAIEPEISSTSPLDGEIDVPITDDVVVTFSEMMNTSSVMYTCSPDPGGWTTSWSNGNKTVTYFHNAFSSETTYTFEITGAKDVEGNDLIPGAVPNPWQFTTKDVITPEIILTSPANGATDVQITANVVVTFSEAMNNSTVTYTCNPDPGGWSVAWSGGNAVASYSHDPFAEKTEYTFEITGGKDDAGNDLAAGGVPNPWTFTSEDITPPQITATSPINNSIDVPISANVVVNFSEEMDTTSVTYTCTPDPGGWTPSWNNGNQAVTYTHNLFASETTYVFEITVAKDIAGNDLAAGAVPNPWQFTTEDIVGPEITITSPADGSYNVAQTANIIVTFSEVMNKSSVDYACSPNPGDWYLSWSNGDTVATFSHNPFDQYTTYTFQITEGKDTADNNLVSGGVPNPWSFTTIDTIPPTITAISPLNGSVDIGLTQNVIVTFSEAMNTSSLSYSCFPDPGGWTISWSSGDTVATLSHNAFNDSTTHSFFIANAKDVAGNNLQASSVTNPWGFTTIDATSPTVIVTSPQNASIDIDLSANVVVSFSEAINPATVAFICTPDPGGWFASWNAQNTTVTYSHDTFGERITYKFQIVAAEDIAGNSLSIGVAPNPWQFITIDTTSPIITSTSPSDGVTDIALISDVTVIFSEIMNTSSISYTCTPDPGGWSTTWSNGDKTASFSHDLFNSSTIYTFQITGGKDVYGNNLVAGSLPNPWSFITIDVAPPTIISTSPINGSTSIGLTNDIVITFIEPMNTASVTYSCSPNPGGWLSSWSNGDRTVTYSHSAFNEQTTYVFQILTGKDIAGNELAAGTVPNPWSFVTEDITVPTITATTPSEGTQNIVLDQDIIVTFSEIMNNSSVTYTCLPDPGGWSVIWNIDNTQVTYSHNLFNSDTSYIFQITGGEDLAGNDLIAGATPNPWSFATLDVVSPRITLISPTNGSTDIDLLLNVTVTFSETMNKSSVTFTCSPDPGGWSLTWSAGDTVATFSHNEFDKSTEYTFQIISGKDTAGNDLIASGIPNPWSFTTEVNIPPTILSTPIITATEDVEYIYDVEAHDDDGDTLTYSLTAYPTGMEMNVTWGLITWVPMNSQVGANSVTVLVSDGDGGTDSQSFTITVANVNDLPIITSTPITTATEDVPYTYDVDASDVDGDTLAYSLSTSPIGMSINVTTGLITWTPMNNQAGPNDVFILVSDGNGGTDTQSFTITVANENDAPTIISAPITTATEDELYVYDVEATDIDVGDTLTYSLTAYPIGMLINATTGVITWTPSNEQVGANSVVALVSDGNGANDTQSFTITVSNINDAPLITSTPVTLATEDMQYIYDVEAMDIEGDTLSYSLSTYPSGMTIDNASGFISWTPTNNQIGNNSVVILVLDGNGGTDSQSFTITVANENDAPMIVSTPITTATEDEQYIYDVDATDIDVGDALTYNLTAYPTGMLIDVDTGVISWTPTNTQVGMNAVTVVVSDGNGGTDTQSFTITVSNINDPPNIFSTPLTGATEEVQYTYDVEASDPDGDMLNFSLSTYPAGMIINATTGLITWTPTNDQAGSHNVYVLVLDGNGGTDTQSFSINVENVNDAPTIISTPIITGTEDELYVYDVDATDIDVGDTLTYSLTAYPIGMVIDGGTGVITWTPTNAHVGMNAVTVLVSDENGGTDTQSFTISISNINNPPSIYSTPLTGATEEIQYTYDVDASDPDGDTLNYSLGTYPTGMTIDNASGYISWTPTNSQVGGNSVVVLVLDGNGGSDTQSFTINVVNTNDAPSIISTPIITATEDDLYVYDVDATDIDVGDTLTYSLTAYPTGMMIDSDTGVISWTPTNAQVGTNAVTVAVSDGKGGTDEQSFTITVSNVNDPPTITSEPITTATEKVQYTYDVEASDVDLGATLNYSLTTNPTGMTIDSAIGLILWIPTNDQVGLNDVVVLVSDGISGTDTQSFTITVANMNDDPNITSTPITTATDDVLYTYDVNASDVDVGDTVSYSLTAYPTGMTIDPTTGLIEWIPNDDQVGTVNVTILVSDGEDGSDTQSYLISVADLNDRPSIISTASTTAIEDTEYTYDVNALDPDDDTLIFSLTTNPNGMTIDSATGLILWTPTNDQVGSNNVVVLVSDGNSGSDTQSFSISVENRNDNPNIISSPITTATEDLIYYYDVEGSDVDVGDTLTYGLTAYPTGMMIDADTGVITWTSSNEQVGVNFVMVFVSDQNGGNRTQSFSIAVSNTNDDPSIISTPIAAGTEDSVYTYDVNATDMDIGDTLTYSLTTYPDAMVIDSTTGVITWTPTNNEVGENPVTVLVDDGNGGTYPQSFTITVSNENDRPSIISVPITAATQDLLYTYDVDAADVDVGDILTYSLTDYPTGMIINSSTGVITWTPTNDQVGDNYVTVEVVDGLGETYPQSFWITVANMNDRPTFNSQPITTAIEEKEYFYEVEAIDIDGDTLTYSLLKRPDEMVIDSDAGTITWMPTNDQVGAHPIIVKVIDDEGDSTKQSFTLIVENVNDKPSVISTPVTTAKEEVVYAYQVQAEDLDPIGDMLTFELSVHPQGMQINSTTGILTWTPTNAQVGDNSVIVIVSDGNDGTHTHAFSINVQNVNDEPIITSTAVTTATEDEQYLYDVNAKDDDLGDSPTYSFTSAPEGMSIGALTGIISWTPTDAEVGTHQIVVKVTDNHSAYTTQSFTITVNNVNDAPEMSSMMLVPETGTNRDKYVFTLTYKDPDGDPGIVKVIINGKEYEMTKVAGDAVIGEVYSREMSLSARNHTYYFEIDDDEGHIIVSNASKISIAAAEVVEDKEESPIPEWWIILILLVIVVVVLLYLLKVKRQQQSKPGPQPLPQKIESEQHERREEEGVRKDQQEQETEKRKAAEKEESDEPGETLLEFS